MASLMGLDVSCKSSHIVPGSRVMSPVGFSCTSAFFFSIIGKVDSMLQKPHFDKFPLMDGYNKLKERSKQIRNRLDTHARRICWVMHVALYTFPKQFPFFIRAIHAANGHCSNGKQPFILAPPLPTDAYWFYKGLPFDHLLTLMNCFGYSRKGMYYNDDLIPILTGCPNDKVLTVMNEIERHYAEMYLSDQTLLNDDNQTEDMWANKSYYITMDTAQDISLRVFNRGAAFYATITNRGGPSQVYLRHSKKFETLYRETPFRDRVKVLKKLQEALESKERSDGTIDHSNEDAPAWEEDELVGYDDGDIQRDFGIPVPPAGSIHHREASSYATYKNQKRKIKQIEDSMMTHGKP